MDYFRPPTRREVMARPIHPGERKDWADEDGTIWSLKILGSRVLTYLKGLVSTAIVQNKKGEAVMDTRKWGVVAIDVVRWGLAGVKNFEDKTIETVSDNRFGKPVNRVSDRFLDIIPPETMLELANHILEANRPSEDELKNSGSRPKSPILDSTAPNADTDKKEPGDATVKSLSGSAILKSGVSN